MICGSMGKRLVVGLRPGRLVAAAAVVAVAAGGLAILDVQPLVPRAARAGVDVSALAPGTTAAGAAVEVSDAAMIGVRAGSSDGGGGVRSGGSGDSVPGGGLAPSWPFRGMVDFGRSEDGRAVLRYWDVEAGRVHDVNVGGGLQGEPCWDDAPFGTEEFVQARFHDGAGRRLIRVPWGDEAYPILVRSEFVLTGLAPAEGFGASFVEDVHRGSVLRVVTPHGEAYYDLGLEFFDYYDLAPEDRREHNSECVLLGPDSTAGIRLELSGTPSDVVDYSEFASQDHPRFSEYLEWARAAPRARFDGTDGYHYGVTILVPYWESGPGSSDSWSFVFAGDTGEVVACRRAFNIAGVLLVRPEGWPDLVDRFVLPGSFNGSGCVGAGEWLFEPVLGGAL